MDQYLFYLSCLHNRLTSTILRSLFTCLPKSIKNLLTQPPVMMRRNIKRMLECDFLYYDEEQPVMHEEEQLWNDGWFYFTRRTVII